MPRRFLKIKVFDAFYAGQLGLAAAAVGPEMCVQWLRCLK
jgi:hypothetical protein